jgi:demethylmenaquinone methyltransferase/2-methoxy-6-polyprenyl-1,4-benzoquinol methylase/phosphoethanolamine N-methyltransferase
VGAGRSTDRVGFEERLEDLSLAVSSRGDERGAQGRMIRWARLYDVGTTLLSFGQASALRRNTVKLAGIATGERILDVGCGPGRLAILAGTVAGPAGEVCGIDPAPEMVALANRNATRAGVGARFEVGVIEALPYADGRFDVVLSSLMLHHLPDKLKRRGFAEVRRVLRPAGRVVAVDFGATPGDGLGHVLCLLGLRRGLDHVERLREMLGEAGFDAIEVGPIGHRAFAFIRARKPAPPRI